MKTECKKIRLLVIDDEVLFTRLLKTNLEQTGAYEVEVVNHPGMAVPAAERFRPEFIMLDVMMPGKDGGDVAAALSASPVLAGVPIVFLTAAVKRNEVLSRGGRIGGLPFLAKPVSIPEIMACISAHLPPTPPGEIPTAMAQISI